MNDEISVFSGQGIPSGQLAELRKVVGVPEVAVFVAKISEYISKCTFSYLSPIPHPTLLLGLYILSCRIKLTLPFHHVIFYKFDTQMTRYTTITSSRHRFMRPGIPT